MTAAVETRRPAWLEEIRSRARLVTFGALALFVVFVVILTPFAISARHASNAARTRWAPARFQALTLLTDFVDQETGERGYIITGDPSYLTPYTKGLLSAPQLIAELERELPASNRALVAAVKGSYARWLASATLEVAAVKERDFNRASSLVESGVGKQRFDVLRQQQDTLVRAVDARFSSSLASTDRANTAFLVALIGLLVLGVAVVWVSGRWLRTSLASGTELHDLERLQSDERRRFVEALQAAVLPALDERGLSLDVAARYRPASATFEIGGDWYDVFRLGEHRVGLVVGDVVGRGIRAAAAMSQLRSALHTIALRCDEPAEVFERLDEFAASSPDAFFTTALYAIYDAEDHTLTYCNAGHPPALLLQAGEPPRYLDGVQRPPIAVRTAPGAARFERVQLRGRSRLVMYTDGLIERRRESLDVGFDRLARAVAAVEFAPLSELADSILTSLATADSRDDTALLVVELVPSDGNAA